MLQHTTYENVKYTKEKFAPSLGLGLKYIKCKTKSVIASKSKVRGLVISDSVIENTSCAHTEISHFILSDGTKVKYSHFTDIKLFESGAVVDTDIHDNVFNSALFHNIHFAKSFFMKNAFINCVFSHCVFDTTTFKDCSFSGTMFFKNIFRKDYVGRIPGMVGCDFAPTTVLGPFSNLSQNYPSLKNYLTRDNISVLNTSMLFKDCSNVRGLVEKKEVPTEYAIIDFDYTSIKSKRFADSGNKGSIYSSKDTQPIPKYPIKNRDKPVRFMSSGL